MFRPIFNNIKRINYNVWFWYDISGNKNAISILEQHLDKVKWRELSNNPNVIHILEQHLDKVDWGGLSLNPNAIHILEKNLDKVDWTYLSENPNAISILENNLDEVHWFSLPRNPNALHLIVRFNKEQMRSNCRPFAEELAQHVFHPLRVERLANLCGLDMMNI